MDYRIGQGYDVHRIEAGLPMWLAGVQVPGPSGEQVGLKVKKVTRAQ